MRGVWPSEEMYVVCGRVRRCMCKRQTERERQSLTRTDRQTFVRTDKQTIILWNFSLLVKTMYLCLVLSSLILAPPLPLPQCVPGSPHLPHQPVRPGDQPSSVDEHRQPIQRWAGWDGTRRNMATNNVYAITRCAYSTFGYLDL